MSRADFNDLVMNLSRKLYGYAYRILRDKAVAEDAVQEIFLKLWEINTKLDEYKSIEALAITMTKNHCIDLLRKLKQYETDDNFEVKFYRATEPTPHEQLESNETKLILDRIIGRLPEIYREMIQLRDIDGLSYEEIISYDHGSLRGVIFAGPDQSNR